MAANKRALRTTWKDPDEAPELEDDFFEEADLRVGDEVIRRGRPKSASPEVVISLRIPPDVLARWKSTGAGWQTRMVEALTRDAPRG